MAQESHVNADPILTATEAAEYLRLESTQTIYNMVARGELPRTKVGRQLLFRQSTLDALVDAKLPVTPQDG
jgi:excisionase family DNA binding protein